MVRFFLDLRCKPILYPFSNNFIFVIVILQWQVSLAVTFCYNMRVKFLDMFVQGSLQTQTYFRLSLVSAREQQPEMRLRSQAKVN